MYRHRASGEVLDGRFRHVMRVKDGLIVRTDEYHDRAKVETFMRLVGGPQGARELSPIRFARAPALGRHSLGLQPKCALKRRAKCDTSENPHA